MQYIYIDIQIQYKYKYIYIYIYIYICNLYIYIYIYIHIYIYIYYKKHLNMCTLPTILHIHLYGQANWMSYSVRRPSQPERQEHRRHMPRTYLLVSLLTFEHVLPLSRQVAASSMRCAQCSEDLVLGI